MKPTLLLLLSFLLTNVLLAQNRFDVVINEIMIDPTPQNGLPANEWIELQNTSALPVNLQGWRIADGSGQSGPMPDFELAPDSFVIICTGSAVAGMSVFGTTISVTSFPSLDNDGEPLILRSGNGSVIHAIEYSSNWYQNELKKEGGWTLEMIDGQSPCAGSSNWRASIDNRGGTPGAINSINANNPDQESPQLKLAFTKDNSTIVLVFDEQLDSTRAASVSNYNIDGGAGIAGALVAGPLFTQVELQTTAPLSEGVIYNVTAGNVTDCQGNAIGNSNKARVGLAEEAVPGDVIVNEILFNPRSNAYDYIEIYNSSEKIIDAAKLHIANRNSSNVVSSIARLSSTPFYFFPGDYLVLTEDADNLALNYLVRNPQAIIVISSLPSYPDDAGSVIILNNQGDISDEVNYSDDWHFKLIDNAEGVSLERIDPAQPSQTAGNWHSAASTAGYGTPGYVNSQFRNPSAISATIEVSPKVFSPDNDGFDDIATIQYRLAEPGYLANLTIFDAAGRPVRNLVRNGNLSTAGYWTWDGLNDKGLKLPVGTYILFTEIFNLQGKKERFKNTVVLARKLN